jgi:hypothetical protein
MEPRFGCNFSQVRMHTGAAAQQSAAELRAHAYTVGHHIVVGQGRFAPGTEGGRRLLAHELAHVVQQGGAKPAMDAPSSGVPGSVRPGTVQRFGELEHKEIGDRAVPGVEFRVSPLVTLTYGDLVAMGDYFNSPDEIVSLAATSGTGKGTIGEVYYAVFVSIRGEDEKKLMGEMFDQTAKEAVNERFYKLAATNVSHFPNPRSGDITMDPRVKAKRHDGERLTGEAATYRDGHDRAVRRAVELGRAEQPIGGALAIDAFYSHFLTDSFSAGHLRTPRVTVINYWQKKVPDFYAQFIAWLGDTIGTWMSHAGGQLAQAAPRGTVRSKAREAVKEALKNMPAMKFGDVISGAVHDFDSERGVIVTVGGKKMRMVGDGKLLNPDKNNPQMVKDAGNTMDLAVKAVQAGERDLQRAYEMGARQTDLGSVIAELTKDGKGLYLSERLVPTPVPDSELTDDDKSLTWAFPSTDQLFEDPRMRRALTVFANNKAGMFDAIMDNPSIDAVAKQGIQVLVQEPMQSKDPDVTIKLFKDILAHPP